MINYKKNCLAVLALLCLEISVNIGNASAQENVIVDTTHLDKAENKKSLSVSLQPLFMLISAGKIDIELQPAGKRHAYIFTAEVYGGRVQDRSNGFDTRSNGDWDKINGAGLGISHKFKFKNERSSPYIAYGLTYRYQEITFETEGFYPYEQDGLTYYEYGSIEKNLVISSGLATTVFGYQKISDDFVYDFYFGFGYKAQLKETDFMGLREYDNSIMNYAYKGFGMVAGLKIGFQFR